MIGPVRSTRFYHLRKIMEYEGILVHAGANKAVTNQLKAYGIQNVSLLGPGGGAFWRESHRSAPHNAYTSTENIRKTGEALGYHNDTNYQAMNFQWPQEVPDGEKMDSFGIRYHQSYRPSYRYDHKEKVYFRYYNDEPHVDEVTQQQLYANNVIIQVVPQWRIEGTSSGVIEMDSVGSGKGYYFSMGKYHAIQWEKQTEGAPTTYYLDSGESLVLNPGKTWVQVIGNEEQLELHHP